jgi:hypothetical protein
MINSLNPSESDSVLNSESLVVRQLGSLPSSSDSEPESNVHSESHAAIDQSRALRREQHELEDAVSAALSIQERYKSRRLGARTIYDNYTLPGPDMLVGDLGSRLPSISDLSLWRIVVKVNPHLFSGISDGSYLVTFPCTYHRLTAYSLAWI